MATAHEPLVLVVDDEEPIRQMETRILRKGGYRVAEAASGPEAIKMLEDGLALDLLIADLEMPQLKGDEMVRRIHAVRPNLKVLYVTGNIGRVLDVRSLVWEGEAFLDKPFTANGLLEAVSLLLTGTVTRVQQYTDRELSTRAFDYARASASGVLLALSFPKYGHPACAWIALTPLLVSLASDEPRIPNPESRRLSKAFSLGLLTGAIYFTGTLYWITRVMAVYGALPMPVAVLINAALIAFMALFPAVFAIVVRRLVLARGPAALMAAPLVWVATELGRTYSLTGFPWVLLGYSQAGVLPIAQLASVFGVYGVSMLVAAVGAALAVIGTAKAAPHFESPAPHFFSYVGHRFSGAERFAPAVVVFAIVIAVAVWGSRRAAVSEWTREGTPIRVGVIQGNVDQGEKWDAARAASIFQDYLRLTRQAMAEGAEFVLWPESSIPFYFEEDPAGAAQVRTLASQARVPMLVGSDQIEWRVENGRRIPTQFFNSAFLVREDGATAGVYRKMHLVPFGEYVPLQRLLFFAAPLTQQSGTFSPGLTAELLPVHGHLVSVAICYEVVYPALVRQFVTGGSELLTTITNDAWFGATSAPYQHFEQASMRAVEEGRYLVRSANTGISGIVDPYGRVLGKTAIYQPAVLVGEARFLRTSTFYARHGDILAYAAVLMTAALLLVARRRVQ